MRKESYEILLNLRIKASADQVFAAVSEAKKLECWWPQRCSGLVALEAEYNFYFSEKYDWYAKIVSYEKDRSIYFEMMKSEEEWENTRFGFNLIEEDESIKLEFSHIGWRTDSDHFRTSSYCWALLLSGLKNYIEEGVIIPFEMRS